MPQPGEFEIIGRWFTRPLNDAAVQVGIGDDAAIVDSAGPLAIAVDMLIAGTHFPAELAADAIGYRALAVNLSDLAAMGARPRWATLALSLPEADATWLENFGNGFFRLAERFGVSLIGGDTTRGPLTATVQLIGNAPERPLLRSGGRPGDRIFVSGTLGDSAAALEHFATPVAERSADAAFLLERFGYPKPRVALGRALAGLAHAAIDISDGLLADLGHLCRQSDCGAAVDLERLPLSPALRSLYAAERAEEFALHGGDDYELCFSVAPVDIVQVQSIAAETATVITDIGELTGDGAITGRRDGHSVPLESKGFVHF
jgi:thiamine-monophosphate kinase